jgi:hypothetical protein
MHLRMRFRFGPRIWGCLGISALALFGCDTLPEQEVLCSTFGRCVPVLITSPFVLGQPDDKTNWLLTGMAAPSGVMITQSKLVVSDYAHGRLLIWNSWPTMNNQRADTVVGQPDFDAVTSEPPAAQATPSPSWVSSDGTNVVIADRYDNRLTFFSASNFFGGNLPAAAFSQQFSPTNLLPLATNYDGPAPLLATGSLYVADFNFNRLLYYSAAPTAPNFTASLVLGQPNAMSAAANAGGAATGMNGPSAPASDGANLYVPDSKNSRVLIYMGLPLMSGSMPALALGQPDLNSTGVNQNLTVGAGTLNNPMSVAAVSGGPVLVADSGNNRVLLWTTLPTTSGAAAAVAIGQLNKTSASASGVSASTLNNPQSVATDGTHLAIADTGNNRVLLYNSLPGQDGAPASLVLGQPDLMSQAPSGVFTNANSFVNPVKVLRSGNRFLVVDSGSNRVLIYPQLPTSSGAQPALVLGQPDFDSSANNSGGISADTLSGPLGAASDGYRLVVADSGNSRVLIWNAFPTRNQQPADLVLGQPDFVSNHSNGGGVGNGFYAPSDVALSDGNLYVADSGNNRVLIWNGVPTMSSQPPSGVLGQPNLSTTTLGGSPAQLYNPRSIYAADQIFVSDTYNYRILIWPTLTPMSGAMASDVIGQNSLSGDNSTYLPVGFQIYGQNSFLADPAGNRIVYWQGVPGLENPAPSGTLGQPNFTTLTPNTGGLSLNSLSAPSSILVTEAGIYIADSGNGRVVAMPPANF